MPHRRHLRATGTPGLRIDSPDEAGTHPDPSPGPVEIHESLGARAKRAVIKDLRHPAAFMFPLRLFIGIGWLRAFAEKVISPDWFDREAVALFLDAQLARDAVAFSPYEQLVESVLRPGSRWIGWVLMALQLVVGLGIITGTYTNLALLIGSSMNANFILAGQLSPSAFYIVIQTVLFVTGAGAILGSDGNRARRPERVPSILLVAHPDVRRTSKADRMALAGLAGLAGGLTWFGFAHVTDFSPSGVGDPALVFGTVMGLSALSLIIFLLRIGALGKPSGPAT